MSDVRWSEVDIVNKLLTVPPERFKSGIAHRVILSLAIVRGLPRSGEFLFSYLGAKPINGWSRAKAAIDRDMGNVLFTTTSRTLFVADTGAGKTMLMVAFAFAMSLGVDFLHWRWEAPSSRVV